MKFLTKFKNIHKQFNSLLKKKVKATKKFVPVTTLHN